MSCNVSEEEFARRRQVWQPHPHDYNSGAIWKYAEQVGPAVNGAVTHPGGAAETKSYADI
jgi:dihydroxy-acid dehydratase